MNEMDDTEEMIERYAAALWRRENPDMSVFDCDAAMQESYRERIRRLKREISSRLDQPTKLRP